MRVIQGLSKVEVSEGSASKVTKNKAGVDFTKVFLDKLASMPSNPPTEAKYPLYPENDSTAESECQSERQSDCLGCNRIIGAIDKDKTIQTKPKPISDSDPRPEPEVDKFAYDTSKRTHGQKLS